MKCASKFLEFNFNLAIDTCMRSRAIGCEAFIITSEFGLIGIEYMGREEVLRSNEIIDWNDAPLTNFVKENKLIPDIYVRMGYTGRNDKINILYTLEALAECMLKDLLGLVIKDDVYSLIISFIKDNKFEKFEADDVAGLFCDFTDGLFSDVIYNIRTIEESAIKNMDRCLDMFNLYAISYNVTKSLFYRTLIGIILNRYYYKFDDFTFDTLEFIFTEANNNNENPYTTANKLVEYFNEK